jgi:hypothetical protein
MPTPEQMQTALEEIADVVGRRYIEVLGEDACGCRYAPEGGGEFGTTYCFPPEPGEAVPFAELDELSKSELLSTYVSWEGFTRGEDLVVMHEVIEGNGPDAWMADIEVSVGDLGMDRIAPEWERQWDGPDADRLHAEWRDDAVQKELSGRGVDYSDKPYGGEKAMSDYDRELDALAARGGGQGKERGRGRQGQRQLTC